MAVRSMTGYGRGETDHNGTKFSVELNSVNRKQSDIVVNLPRDLAELEPRVRQTINESISRGRTNVVITYHDGSGATRKLALDPDVVKKYRAALLDRIQKAGLPVASDDERLVKEVSFFADRSDISEELTRIESHLAQFAHHLRRNEPVGRTLEFITQEIFRELNTLGAKANDATISQHVVACKAELEKICEQIQNL